VTGPDVNSSDNPETSLSLLDRLRAMDQDAWRRFVQVYGPLVYRWCRDSGLQDADAQDVGQDVLRSVTKAIADFDRRRGAGSFRAWLRVVTINKIRDLARRRQGQAAATGGSDANAAMHAFADPVSIADEASDAQVAVEQQQVLRRAIEALLADCEETTRQAFWRVVVERQNPGNVAKELGISINSVYLAKSRLLKRLRDEFADLIDMKDLDSPEGDDGRKNIAPQ